MKNKGIPFIEQHIEKFVLGAAGAVFFSVIAWRGCLCCAMPFKWLFHFAPWVALLPTPSVFCQRWGGTSMHLVFEAAIRPRKKPTL